jgi:hypothetical protein
MLHFTRDIVWIIHFFRGIITAHSLDELPAGVQLLSDNQLDGYRTVQSRLKV